MTAQLRILTGALDLEARLRSEWKESEAVHRRAVRIGWIVQLIAVALLAIAYGADLVGPNSWIPVVLVAVVILTWTRESWKRQEASIAYARLDGFKEGRKWAERESGR